MIEVNQLTNKLNYLNLENKELENGTLLIGHVPQSGKFAYLHRIYSRLTMKQVSEYENEKSLKINPIYKKFLTEVSNGITIFLGAISLFGIRRNYARTGIDMFQPFDLEVSNKHERIKDACDDVFFIGSYKSDGSRIFMKGDSETIYRCERYSINVLNEWQNLEEFLQHEFNRLVDHFDSDGNRVDIKRPTTP